MFREITHCRVCGNENLIEILDLGFQALSGIFPKRVDEFIPKSPLSLVKCFKENSNDHCGLVQLKHTYDLNQLYGKNYGYRSSLNTSMTLHLKNKVNKILEMVDIEEDDYIIDIGSNDGTTLKNYSNDKLNLIGVDPTGVTFKKYYPPHIHLISDFFSADVIKKYHPNLSAKIITSFSMFYDLEDPLQFMRDIKEILHQDGIWVFEQSYLPLMLEKTSYDTICHEHLEYYGLKQIYWMCKEVGFKIVDVEFNDINGGSFSCSVTHHNSDMIANTEKIKHILQNEDALNLSELEPYQRFSEKVAERSDQFKSFIYNASQKGKRVGGLGASTKGNVILQYAGITSQDMECIGEVNSDKFGSYTPGTQIPIVPEYDILERNMDYYVVLPWHFKQHFITNEKYSKVKDRLIFPLPSLAGSI